MVCRTDRLVLAVAGLWFGAGALRAQDMPDPQALQNQVHLIVQQRPREAEAAARAFLMLVAPNLVPTLDSLKVGAGPIRAGNQPLIIIDGVPQPGFSDEGGDQYWAEVGQLTAQFGVVQNLNRRDSVRAQLVGKMFGLEANARVLQRAYRYANEEQRTAFRGQLERLIGGHFDIENQLRLLEIKDIERRLTDVRAETKRRIDKRTEFIQFAVDDIIRDAIRPR